MTTWITKINKKISTKILENIVQKNTKFNCVIINRRKNC